VREKKEDGTMRTYNRLTGTSGGSDFQEKIMTKLRSEE
jgi:hypothetical protein